MDYEKKYKEALETARQIHDGNPSSGTAMVVCEQIFPELAESEDERIRKKLIETIGYFRSRGIDQQLCEEFLTYLEKHKENVEKEYVFRPLAGTDITIAAEQAIRRAMEGDHLVLAFNGWYVPVDKYATTKGLVDSYDTFIEKQKEQKPTSPEDMPYITDEHFFEREPKDSFKYKLAKYMTQNCRKEESPDGYTYHISAETILEMAKEELIKRGELKEQKPIQTEDEKEYVRTLKSLIADFLRGKEEVDRSYYQKIYDWLDGRHIEQKPREIEWEDAETLAYIRDILKKHFLRSEEFEDIDRWLTEHYIEQKPEDRFEEAREKYQVEWSEEDGKMIDHLIEALPMWANGRIAMLPSQAEEYVERLKSLRPSWKPSEEQMEHLQRAINCYESDWGENKALRSVINELKKLM